MSGKRRSDAQRGKRWAYGQLTVSDIVAAAGSMIRRDGVEALSMRRVADELGLSTMAMYYHVDSKRGLLALVVDEALKQVMVPPADAGTWDERLRMLMSSAYAELRRYPGLVTAMVDQRLLTPRSEQLQESAQDMLADAGFTGDEVALRNTMTVFVNQLFGTVSWTIGTPGGEDPDPEPPAGRAEELFDFGLTLIIDGLKARLRAGAPAVRDPSPISGRAATGS